MKGKYLVTILATIIAVGTVPTAAFGEEVSSEEMIVESEEETISEDEVGSEVENVENASGSQVEENMDIEDDTPVVGDGKLDMYRLYNPNSGEHFYTGNTGERDHLAILGWRYEGTGWTAPTSGNPVYRLYNPNAGDHHYTTSAGERDALKRVGWRDEGIGWYSATTKNVPVYRQYNPNAKAGAHNFTTNKGENDSLVRVGWRGEGVAWYAIGSGKQAPVQLNGDGVPSGFVVQSKMSLTACNGEYHDLNGNNDTFGISPYSSDDTDPYTGVMHSITTIGGRPSMDLELEQLGQKNLYKINDFDTGRDTGRRITFYKQNGKMYTKIYDRDTNQIITYVRTREYMAG